LIDHLDHLVLTTADKDACIAFYTTILGMQLESFGEGGAERIAFRFGNQKINLHERGREFEPKAQLPTPGSLDLCFIASIPLDEFIAHCHRHGVPILAGPVKRAGAQYAIRSVYLRDPDQNLIEVSERWSD
jgi:catechol 2,3-dioxygenase-like lactoylglutathione lyase family enzyme